MSDPAGDLERPAPRTSTRGRILVLVLFAVMLAPASWLARRGASRMDYFHVRAVEVRGTRYLDPERIVAQLALDTMRSVWDDLTPLATRLDSLPQVGAVEVSRKLPGTIVVSIQENQPVALVSGPSGLEAVDSAGIVLPIDPAKNDLDLPIALQRDVPLLALLGAMRAGNSTLYGRLTEVARDGKSDVVLRLASLPGFASLAGKNTDALDAARSGEPFTSIDSVASSVPSPPRLLTVRASLGVSVSRLADIFPVESDLLRRRANVAELDLRYRDQVIARLQ
ncbi:MAG TPA: FtsQ-type POTRA domain-containing protein [Gemmatimonadaceae bacterium]|nr:FtsQ-type POTRA domain-containing protein [Gemmatimonadaceae bacterium]